MSLRAAQYCWAGWELGSSALDWAPNQFVIVLERKFVVDSEIRDGRRTGRAGDTEHC